MPKPLMRVGIQPGPERALAPAAARQSRLEAEVRTEHVAFISRSIDIVVVSTLDPLRRKKAGGGADQCSGELPFLASAVDVMLVGAFDPM